MNDLEYVTTKGRFYRCDGYDAEKIPVPKPPEGEGWRLAGSAGVGDGVVLFFWERSSGHTVRRPAGF